MRTWPAVAILAGTCLFGAAVGSAAAGSLNINGSPVEAGSVAITAACASPPLSLAAPRSAFTAPGTYRLRQVPVSAVVAACQSKPFQVTIANNATPYTTLTNWGGTLPGATSGTLTDATGLDVNSLPSTNSVRTYLLVRTS